MFVDTGSWGLGFMQKYTALIKYIKFILCGRIKNMSRVNEYVVSLSSFCSFCYESTLQQMARPNDICIMDRNAFFAYKCISTLLEFFFKKKNKSVHFH
jgi:IMP cyclohydrolase